MDLGVWTLRELRERFVEGLVSGLGEIDPDDDSEPGSPLHAQKGCEKRAADHRADRKPKSVADGPAARSLPGIALPFGHGAIRRDQAGWRRKKYRSSQIVIGDAMKTVE
jgi:hypothetical protein